MPSVVDICNLALSHIGDRATLTSIDPPEGSAQADHCARFWPIARDEALSEHDWGFARRTANLTQLSTEDHPSWTFAYARPADMLVARQLQYPDAAVVMLTPGHPYFEEGTQANGQRVLYANSDMAMIRYTRSVTDPSLYPAKFVTALAYLLASYLAGPVIKGRAGVSTAQAMRQVYVLRVAEAATVDANQSHETTAFKPSALRARGYAGTGRIIEEGQYRRELPFWAQG